LMLFKGGEYGCGLAFRAIFLGTICHDGLSLSTAALVPNKLVPIK
jgi:hypothetical protein